MYNSERKFLILVSVLLVLSFQMVYAIDGPAFSIGFDHAYKSHESAAQYMNDKGMRGSFWVVTKNLDNPNSFMDTNTLLQFQDQNWEIASHTNDHTKLTGVDQSIIDYEVIESKEILENLGFQVYGFVQPNGAWDEQSLATMLENYDWVTNPFGRLDQTYDEPTDTYLVDTVPANSLREVNDFESAKLKIDEAIINNEIVIFTFHDLENLSNPYSFPMVEFLKIIDYLDELNVPVVSMAELYDLTGPRSGPTANAGGPYPGTAGEAVTFDGTASSDPDGSIVSFDWNFGDGNTGTGLTPSHTYAADDTYTVTLTVTDDSGATDSATTTATISAVPNQLPIADAGGPYPGTAVEAVTFDGTASSDPDGTIVSFDWNFGDGNTGTGLTPSHTYAADDTYTVTLTVTDDGGATDSATTTATISAAENSPPTADAGPDQSVVSQTDPVILDGTGSFDSDGTIVSYEWVKIKGPKVTLTDANTDTPEFTAPQVKGKKGKVIEFQLTVTDDQGARHSDIVRITITKS